jgi:Zn-dependent peptidase ImmA (M78 family)
LTGAALSQFEAGSARPSPHTRQRLAYELGVPESFFELPLAGVHEGFFRSLRRTAVGERRRARAAAHIAHDVATLPSIPDDWPRLNIPSEPVSLDPEGDAIESIAKKVREQWRLPPGPIPNAIQLLEAHGVVVVRLPLDSTDVDAFSLPFPDHPVVVLSSNKNDKARSRFDAAHELGHLVMHGESVWGLPGVEAQAHSFAAAFLMPREDIAQELPERADWPRLFQLKRRWQVSIAALLMRARELERMSPSTYLSAVKSISMRGWRRLEPVPLGEPERPQLFPARVEQLRSAGPIPLPARVVEALAAASAA